MLFMMGSGEEQKNKDMESKFGLMELNMKGNGKTIKLQEEENLLM